MQRVNFHRTISIGTILKKKKKTVPLLSFLSFRNDRSLFSIRYIVIEVIDEREIYRKIVSSVEIILISAIES